jgi:hypothetical protein
MKTRGFRTAVMLPMIFLIPFTIGLGGCASTPPSERPDSEKIQQDSDKSMQDLKKEEDQRGNGY